MYIPKQYRKEDYQEIKDFIQRYNFATIISTVEGRPLATHIPVNVQEDGDALYITGHVAKRNQQWKTLDKGEHILVIFQGPHAYISSTWYENDDVPTWNYQSIQVYGNSRLLKEDELITDLTRLLNKYEAHREHGATWDNMSEKSKSQVKGIVGFRIKVTELYAAYKLSQSRSVADKDHIIDTLSSSEDHLDHAVAKAMTKEQKSTK
ncbi:FMN-binding negative transcriptional regulator [Staphylococcus sp. ACRSN]|uniref:FMN-binding negative transcriptional regulator n=1 Tax=Staphylococcus sp. ACRSN TaxID=2918214 RepID=UPI001EF32B5C|nr:FMN-binding negative transcriptional regulator [Staphylococcus sp. ACRSN]MCG7337856.1 FMN-binding negative transcriptional regulator [Staphylococcus sp. ACRSN]